MAYSRWIDTFWYTSCITGAPHIDASKIYVNPRKGEPKTFLYREVLDVDEHWVSLHFPDAPQHYLGELLRYIHIFVADMKTNVYRYAGYKEPTVGVLPHRTAA